MTNIAHQLASANDCGMRYSPNVVHVAPNSELEDHDYGDEGCWCEPNAVYTDDGIVRVHKRTRAD